MRSLHIMLLSLVLAAGCCTAGSGAAAEAPPEIVAVRASGPIHVDGTLGEPSWSSAPAYPLSLSDDAPAEGKTLTEGGTVKFLWDDQYFYMGVEFTDSDVVAEGETDELLHCSLGDLAELFLWPDDQTWYWEMYVTPRNKQTTYFFPSGGRILPSSYAGESHLTVAAQVDGTLNNWTDRDRKWTAEMAVPVKQLTAHGEKWGPGSHWRILVGRYNYSRYLFTTELSMMPRLSKTSFHLRREYGRLLFRDSASPPPNTK